MENTTTGSSPATLYAAGLNAHFQVTTRTSGEPEATGEDVNVLTPLSAVSKHQQSDFLLSTWSSSHFFTPLPNPQLLHLGKGYVDEGAWQPAPASRLHSAFGDHDGLIGCLDEGGALYVVPDNGGVSGLRRRHGTLVCQSTSSSPPLRFIAMAGNGRVALTFMQAPNARLSHIAEFKSLEACLNYYRDPSDRANYPETHRMLPGRPKQLLASTAQFAMLMENGEVYSWGDPRHQSLGRKTVGDGSTTASSPGLVEALAGLRMSKIAIGGWACAALSEDGAAYLWGAATPGTGRSLPQLGEADAGEVVLVTLPTGSDDDILDIADIALGDAHAVWLSEQGRLFVGGDNSNGQLGLTTAETFLDAWTEMPFDARAERVACGPRASFVFARDSRHQ